MKKVVIIGGVAAGLKSAAKIRRGNPEVEITVVERGEIISYGACGIPYFVSGEVRDIKELMMTPVGVVRGVDFFRNVKGVSVLIKTQAINIDKAAKKVTVKNLDTQQEYDLAYDKLVIATGASPIKPALPGIELAGIHSLWHPDDAVAVRSALESGQIKNAVIIGAGLVGMEMAEAIKKWGVNVAVVEMKEYIFPAFLDEEVAKTVEKYLRAKNIQLFTGEKVLSFSGQGRVQEVLTDKQNLPADLVVLAMGVKPNVELAREAGLVIGTTGAIAVNEYMETSDPNIFAGGDCVENFNIVSGKNVFAPMGSTANKHGRIIGENICGGQVAFRGILSTLVVRVTDMNIGKVGLSEKEAKSLGYQYVTVLVPGHDKPHYMPEAKLITVKLIADAGNGKLLGAQVFGQGDVAKRIDVIAAVLTFGGTVDNLFDIDLSYAPPFNSPIDNAAVAANVLMNKLSGSFKGISSLTAKEKLADENTIFLDVRSPGECQAITLDHCKGLTNIPLGQLRERLGELDKKDEIIAFCKISLRGYEAETILEGAGFDNVTVMEGGIAAWPFECITDLGEK